MKKPIDIHKTLRLTTDAHDRRVLILAVCGLAMGAFLLFVATKTRGGDNRLFGAAMMLFAFGYLIYALVRSTEPLKPLLELSSRGLVYRGLGERDLVLSWNDVSAVETIYNGRHKGAPIYKIAVVVPHRLIETRFKTEQTGLGQLWTSRAIERQGNDARIILPHDRVSLTYGQLRDELEERWRAFSDHPNAKQTPAARVDEEREKKRWPRELRIVVAIAAVVFAAPVIYYGNWIMLWLGTHNPDEWTQREYLQLLLKRETLTIRQSNANILRVSGLQVADARETRCATEIERVGAAVLLPRYERVTYCQTAVRLRSGEEGAAVWKVYRKTDTTSFDGRPIVTSYTTAGSVEPSEVATVLCKMGRC